MELVDRRAECGQLDLLMSAVTAGDSRALVLSGPPGVGKTALLDYLAGQASKCRVVRIAGVQSEMELAYSALHQLCAHCGAAPRSASIVVVEDIDSRRDPGDGCRKA